MQGTRPLASEIMAPSMLAIMRRAHTYYNFARYVRPVRLAGARVNVILFPPILGGMYRYTPLIAELHEHANVYAANFPCEFRPLAEDLINNLGLLFAHCIAALRLKGPLILIGWSFGGTLAYECARRLPLLDVPVDELALLDPAVRAHGARCESILRSDRLGGDDLWKTFLFFKLAPADWQRLAEESHLFQLSFRARLAMIRRYLPRLRGPHFRRANLAWEFRFFQSALRSLDSYVPGSYGGKCSIFLSEGQHYPASQESVWAEAAISSLKITRLRGDHLALVSRSIGPLRRLVT
jgi:thioesterase domain-containing protein